MKVLVVGGAGYVGSVLVSELLHRGYGVRVLDRFYYGRQSMADVAASIELVAGDMRTVDRSLMKGVDAVVNVGGLSNDPTAEYNPRANFEMNVVATQRLAELCRDAGVRRYVFASSASVYDRGVDDPDLDVVLDETADVNPTAPYSKSKYDAERILLNMASDDFCPVILRMGTLYGWSPRMRYDLVVNTFVKDAMSKGTITVNYGGEMWRPLVSVRDAARAYVECVSTPEDRVRGQIFNLVYANYRISELALRVQRVFRDEGVRSDGADVVIRADYGYSGVRNYRVSARKLRDVVGFAPNICVEGAVSSMVYAIRTRGAADFDNPRYYNIRWIKVLEEAASILGSTASVFDAPDAPDAR